MKILFAYLMAVFSPQKKWAIVQEPLFSIGSIYFTLFMNGGTSILLFPHTLSDGQFGLMLVVILPVMGSLYWLYNAYRMGRLKWKPKGPANPRLVCLVILLLIIASAVLLSVIE